MHDSFNEITSQIILHPVSLYNFLTANGDGTDHGWGGHHFIIGEGVNGNRIFGDIPPSDFEHDLDAGNGRLIPSTSLQEFAAPLGRWFGLTEAELLSALPGISH